MNGFGSSSGTQDQCLLVIRFQQRFDGTHKPDNVRVVSFQFGTSLGVFHFNYVHRSDFACILIQFVQIGNNFLFVRDSHIQSCKRRICLNDVRKFINAWNFKVHIFGINILGMELLIEKISRE